MHKQDLAPSAHNELRIERVGADGDGVAHADGKPVYTPFTLPGELVRAGEVLEPSADRVAPPCRLFGACGGCVLQHWADPAYAQWKRDQLSYALSRAGYENAVLAPLIRTPPAARRRVELAVQRDAGRILIGLHERRSHQVTDMTECYVVHPSLFALIDPLRALLRSLSALKRQGEVLLNLLESGPDLLLRTDGELTSAHRTELARFAAAHAIPRIAWAKGNAEPEQAVVLSPVSIGFGDARVQPPPGAFLQASAEGEAGITAAVLAGLPKKLTQRSAIFELYAGCGTLTFPLSQHARVVAYEGAASAVQALRKGVSSHRIEVCQRDLARQPLMRQELARAAVVVLDPPYSGAQFQVEQLAQSDVPTIIYVSCNPGALSRDAQILQKAGYTLQSATPIDQFLWSAQLESVVVFTKPAVRKKPI